MDSVALLSYKLGLVDPEIYDEGYVHANDLSQRAAW